MFAEATKIKLRFKSQIGLISTEDLWDLQLNSLYDIGNSLNKELKNDEDAFFSDKNTDNSIDQLRFDIVKHIIQSKRDTIKSNQERIDNKAELDKILAIIDEKQDEDLKDKSLSDLKKLAKKLKSV